MGGFIPNPQILWAFAALNVVAFHALVNANDYFGGLETSETLRGWGMSGVDIFFVLSGFIMVHTQFKDGFDFGKFAWGRFTRIVPVYVFLTLTVFSLFLLLPSLFRQADYEATHLIASLFFVSQPTLGINPIIGYGWTLEYEMLFYLCFGVVVALGARQWHQFMLAMLIVAVGLVHVVGVGVIFYEFLFGIGIAFIYRALKDRQSVGLVLLVIGAAMLVSTAFYQPTGNRVFDWGIPATFLVLGGALSWQLNWRPLTYLGDASYSIYVVQVLTVPGTMKALSIVWSDVPPALALMSAIVTTAIAGALIYQFFERPTLAAFRRRRPVYVKETR